MKPYPFDNLPIHHDRFTESLLIPIREQDPGRYALSFHTVNRFVVFELDSENGADYLDLSPMDLWRWAIELTTEMLTTSQSPVPPTVRHDKTDDPCLEDKFRDLADRTLEGDCVGCTFFETLGLSLRGVSNDPNPLRLRGLFDQWFAFLDQTDTQDAPFSLSLLVYDESISSQACSALFRLEHLTPDAIRRILQVDCGMFSTILQSLAKFYPDPLLDRDYTEDDLNLPTVQNIHKVFCEINQKFNVALAVVHEPRFFQGQRAFAAHHPKE